MTRSAQEMKKIEELMKHHLLQNEEKAVSYLSMINCYDVHALYYWLKGNGEKSYEYRKSIVKLMESYPVKTINEQEKYATVLLNLAIIQFDLKKYQEGLPTIHKIMSIPFKAESVKNKITKNVYAIKLEMYIQTVRFKEGVNEIKRMENWIEQHHEDDKYYNVILYYLISYLYFGAQDYHHSLRWINKLLNEPGIEQRQDIICFIRIFSLFIHLEIGNRELINYHVLSTFRFLRKKNRLYQFESCILKYMRKRFAGNNKSDLIEIFQALRNDLVEIMKDPFERKAMEYFDIISWLESKMQNKPFEEVLRKKSGT